MSGQGTVIGNLAASLRAQIDGKTLKDSRQWAFDIVAQHERGEYGGLLSSLKLAQSVVLEAKRRDFISVGNITKGQAEEILRKEQQAKAGVADGQESGRGT